MFVFLMQFCSKPVRIYVLNTEVYENHPIYKIESFIIVRNANHLLEKLLLDSTWRLLKMEAQASTSSPVKKHYYFLSARKTSTITIYSFQTQAVVNTK